MTDRVRSLSSSRPKETAVKTRRREYLSIPDLCAELGISRDTFYKWRARGAAPRCTKLPNGALRILRDDLEDWLNDRKEVA